MGTSLSTPCHNKTVKQRRFLHVETHTFWFHVTIIQPSHWDCVSKRARLSPQACSRSELDFSVLIYPLPLEPCYNPWSWPRTMLQSDPNGARDLLQRISGQESVCGSGANNRVNGCSLHTEYESGSSSWHPCEWFSNETSVAVAFP